MAGGGIAGAPGVGKNYPGKLTAKVLTTCIVAAFGGLIFGYDLGISGLFFNFYIFNVRACMHQSLYIYSYVTVFFFLSFLIYCD